MLKYKKQGLTNETASLLVNFVLQRMQIDQVLAFTHKHNAISVNVVSKLGFKGVVIEAEGRCKN